MFKLRITGDLGFEVWQDIPGYEGLYQASTYGRVRSTKKYRENNDSIQFLSEKARKGTKNPNGYIGINLCKNGIVKRHTLHRIIALIFIPNFFNYSEVNHKDENKLNNRVENLEWCTHKYNSNYGTRNQRSAKKRINHPAIVKPVAQYDIYGNFIGKYISAREAHRLAGFSFEGIGRCCKGKNKTCGGYVWKYA